MLFLVPPERQAAVKQALGLLHVPFRLSWQGSTIIHYDPESNLSIGSPFDGPG
jgi:hypothetical protein